MNQNKEKEASLSLDEAKKVISYDPITGIFTRIKAAGGKASVGSVCGTVVGSDGYRRISVCGMVFLAQRLAWFFHYGEWPVDDVDHRDGNRDFNAIANLRSASRKNNNYNRIPQKNCSSGYKGVSWHKRMKLWRATMYVDGKQKFLGHYRSPEEASAAYERAAKIYQGDFSLKESRG